MTQFNVIAFNGIWNINMLKRILKYFRSQTVMYRNSFVSPCTRTINLTYTIFNAKHTIANLKNIYKFHGIRRIIMRTGACTDKQADKIMSIFQLRWKMLKINLIYKLLWINNMLNQMKKYVSIFIWKITT